MRRAVHQFIPGVLRRDGVGDEVLAWQRIFRAAGYDSELFVGDTTDDAEGVHALRDYAGDARNLLICHHAIGNDFVGLLERLPDRLVLRFHNLTPSRFFAANPAMQHNVRLGWRQVRYLRDLVVGALCASTFNADSLRRYGYPDPVIVPSAFSLDRLRARQSLPRLDAPADEPLVLCVARGAANKRLEHVVLAFEHFVARFAPRARLALVGDLYADFDYGAAQAERLRRSPVRDRIDCPGSVSDAELVDYYRRARLYLSMSEHEGFCIPPLEAFGWDVPVLAYHTPAVAETMGGAGIIFTRKAWDEVAALMAELCFDDGLRARVIAAQRARLTRPDLGEARPRLLRAVEAWLPPAVAGPARARRPRPNGIGIVSSLDGNSEVATCTRALAAEWKKRGIAVTILAEPGAGFGPDPAHVVRIVSDRPEAYVSSAIEHGVGVVHRVLQPARGLHTVHTRRVLAAFLDAGLPVHVTVHGPLFPSAPFLQPLADLVPTLAACTGIFAHDAGAAEVLRGLGLTAARTLPLGVPSLAPAAGEELRDALGLRGRRVIAFTGAANAHSGLREAIQAMYLLHEQHPEVLLVALAVAASADQEWYLRECRERIARLGLSPSVFLLDRPLSEPLHATILQAAEAVLMPVQRGDLIGSPRWPIACGRPVIAPAWFAGEALRDAVAPLAAATPQHIARAVRVLLSDAPLRDSLAAGAARLAAAHSWSRVADAYLGDCPTPLAAAG
ncbi:MAG: glycosyltransferase [Deltaproteobacteria bacterium]|nr:glycosyltransferase [Deltaproteobacteria bacterium]